MNDNRDNRTRISAAGSGIIVEATKPTKNLKPQCETCSHMPVCNIKESYKNLIKNINSTLRTNKCKGAQVTAECTFYRREGGI